MKDIVLMLRKSSVSGKMTATSQLTLRVRPFPPVGLPSVELSYD